MILKNVFGEYDVALLNNAVKDYKTFEYQPSFSRYIAANKQISLLETLSKKLVPLAKHIFGSTTLAPTYSLFAHYEGENASLYKHKDDNACTYTLDYCLYADTPWDLWVESKPYKIDPNEALAYYGNDQLHWREEFPNPKRNKVAMIFFHFADSDHWWFTKGPGYLQVIRGKVTEEEWNQGKH